MTLRTVLQDAFELLRERPLLFVPRLVMTGLWSVFWVMLFDQLQMLPMFSLERLLMLAVFAVVATPAQVIVFNMYFIVVQQYEDGYIDLIEALKKGSYRLPQGMAAFGVIGLVIAVLAIPGILIAMYGLFAQILVLAVLGVLLSGLATMSGLVLTYFAPVSAVIGEKSWWKNIRNGITASRNDRRAVTLITLFSFGTLIITSLLQGVLEQIGIVGFFLGRGIGAVIGVYLLLVNPERYLDQM